MAPTITTQLHLLVSNAEVSFGTVTSPTGFDFIDAFVDGSANPGVIPEWRLYEIVAGTETLIATASGGGQFPAVLDWGVGGRGFSLRTQEPQPQSPAEGAGFTFELRAFLSEPSPSGGPQPAFTASLIGYDEFDTAANSNIGSTQTIPANFNEVILAAALGYAQFADCIVTQSMNVPVEFTLYAIAGGGGVTAKVAQITLDSPGRNTRLFGSPVRLPGATGYVLRAKFDSNLLQFAPPGPVVVSGAIGTHSTQVAGAAVVTLTGNDNGPSNANRFLSLPIPLDSANVVIPEVGPVPGDGWWNVGIQSLAGPAQVLLPANPTAGEVVTITDEAGVLATPVSVNGNGHNVQGVPVFTMNAAYPGVFGSIALIFDVNPNTGVGAWFIFADRNTVSGGGGTFKQTTIVGNDADVPAAAFPVMGGWTSVRMVNLTADRTVNLPAAPNDGDVAVVKSGAGGLESGFNIIVNGNGNTIDAAATDTLTIASPGQNGSRSYYFDTIAPNPGWFAF